jgi:hypothetical protein
MASPACDADTFRSQTQGQIPTQASSEKIDTVASWREPRGKESQGLERVKASGTRL